MGQRKNTITLSRTLKLGCYLWESKGDFINRKINQIKDIILTVCYKILCKNKRERERKIMST